MRASIFLFELNGEIEPGLNKENRICFRMNTGVSFSLIYVIKASHNPHPTSSFLATMLDRHIFRHLNCSKQERILYSKSWNHETYDGSSTNSSFVLHLELGETVTVLHQINPEHFQLWTGNILQLRNILLIFLIKKRLASIDFKPARKKQYRINTKTTIKGWRYYTQHQIPPRRLRRQLRIFVHNLFSQQKVSGPKHVWNQRPNCYWNQTEKHT